MTLVSGDNQATPVNTPFPSPLTVFVANAAGLGVQGVNVTFSLPGNGSTGVFAGSPGVTTDARGFASSPVVIADGTSGSYIITATAAGGTNPSVAFHLTNLTTTPAAPTVLALQRFGFHAQPTTLVLTFSQSLDSARPGRGQLSAREIEQGRTTRTPGPHPLGGVRRVVPGRGADAREFAIAPRSLPPDRRHRPASRPGGRLGHSPGRHRRQSSLQR